MKLVSNNVTQSCLHGKYLWILTAFVCRVPRRLVPHKHTYFIIIPAGLARGLRIPPDSTRFVSDEIAAHLGEFEPVTFKLPLLGRQATNQPVMMLYLGVGFHGEKKR